MGVSIVVDVDKCTRDLDAIAQKQVPFALANTLNALAKEGQLQARVRMHRIFTLRRPVFAERSVKIVHFANKRELFATVGIHPPGSLGDSRSDIFTKFETDTQKVPKGRTIAVPVSARLKRNNAGIIAKRERPAAYNFRQVGRTIRGDRRTFIVKKPDGSGVILQRTGKGKGSQVQALYILVKRARIKPDLNFIPTFARVVDKNSEPFFTRELNKALSTAKP